MKSPFGLNATKIEPSENCDDDTGMFFPVHLNTKVEITVATSEITNITDGQGKTLAGALHFMKE
jgi:hypothetical protein